MPSFATRTDFFEAPAIPFFLRISSAFSRSPPDSVKAFLQSIIPALVFSRNCLTSVGLTSAIIKVELGFRICVPPSFALPVGTQIKQESKTGAGFRQRAQR